MAWATRGDCASMTSRLPRNGAARGSTSSSRLVMYRPRRVFEKSDMRYSRKGSKGVRTIAHSGPGARHSHDGRAPSWLSTSTPVARTDDVLAGERRGVKRHHSPEARSMTTDPRPYPVIRQSRNVASGPPRKLV